MDERIVSGPRLFFFCEGQRSRNCGDNFAPVRRLSLFVGCGCGNGHCRSAWNRRSRLTYLHRAIKQAKPLNREHEQHEDAEDDAHADAGNE